MRPDEDAGDPSRTALLIARFAGPVFGCVGLYVVVQALVQL